MSDYDKSIAVSLDRIDIHLASIAESLKDIAWIMSTITNTRPNGMPIHSAQGDSDAE